MRHLHELPTAWEAVCACRGLDELAALLDARGGELSDSQWTDLPTFGGTEPSSTHGVYSWDATRLLVGTHLGGQPGEMGALRIVPRSEAVSE